MVSIQKQTIRAERQTEHPLLQLGLACAAALFVGLLLLTYGLDLSPGLF